MKTDTNHFRKKLGSDLRKEQFVLITCSDCVEEQTLYPTEFGLFWQGFILSCIKHGEIISSELHSKQEIDKFFHINTPLECECHQKKGVSLD